MTIESHWRRFASIAIPHETPGDLKDAMRASFYAGAITMMDCATNNMVQNPNSWINAVEELRAFTKEG